MLYIIILYIFYMLEFRYSIELIICINKFNTYLNRTMLTTSNANNFYFNYEKKKKKIEIKILRKV